MESLANLDPPESAQEHIQMCEKHFLRKDITCDDCDEFICKQCAKTDHVDHDWTTISTDANQVEKLTKIVGDMKIEITKERERSTKMSLKLQEITKDKEDLLIRLSKIAGSKLTSNNPDIADLSDDNRPTKLAEKFGQLYDDAWTDSLEELTEVETKLDEGVAIGFLLQIILWKTLQAAYQFCRGPRSTFLDLTDCQTIMTCANLKDMKVLIKITESSKVDIQPRIKMSLHAKETVSEMQKV
uniref:Uncharacterized protein n=1 Tax=Magallana gigas TaxID=29159 RepID=K1R9X8_MAGGI